MRKLKKYKPTRFMAKTSHYDQDTADFAVMFIESLCHTKGTAMSVQSVERSFTAMRAKSVSIVAAGAISPPDTAVRVYPLTASEIAENEGFLVGISIFRSMRDKGLISSDEYDQIHTSIANKSAAVLSDLYR